MKYLLKNTLIKIRKSLGRFLSISLIIALGVSVFLGLYESTQSMLYTADKYFDNYKLMDFKISSTHGFTKGDIDSIKELDYIKEIIPTFSIDVLDDGKSIRVHALEKDVNNVIKVAGKSSLEKNECLADFDNYKLGDIITFQKDDLADFLSIEECKVVGLVSSPIYIREDKGISNIGNGKLESFIYINKENFNLKYYTDIFIIGNNTTDKSSYFEDYEQEINLINEELLKIKPIRETIRYEEILKEVTEEVNKLEKEINTKFSEALTDIAKEEKKLDDALKLLEDKELEVKNKINEALKKLNYEKTTLLNFLKNYGLNESNLSTKISELKNGISMLNLKLTTLDPSSEEYKKAINQIKEFEKEFETLTEFETNLNLINDGIKDANKELSGAEIVFKEEYKNIFEGYKKLNDGKEKIALEEKKIQDQIDEELLAFNTMDKPLWYLLDRTDNSGYTSYKEDIIKVDSIAKILPIFFILITALMILNTLTRLIEEERTEMGILLANGFGKASITFTYLFYVLFAGIFGLAVGLTIGYSLIPQIIYTVFLARYYVPKLITIVSPLPFSLVITLTIILMVIITLSSLLKDLKYSPASLLRPKTPKVGKKIFLENITVFWNKLNFMGKTTLRNLFRYKKRIFMTILGVAGCTGLLVAGLGINDSINKVSNLQYKEIIKYNSMYILKDETIDLNNNLVTLLKDNDIEDYLLVNQNNFKFNFKNKTEDVYVLVPKQMSELNNYVNLKNIYTEKEINLTNDGVIITKQMGELLKVNSGDLINIRNSDNELFYMYVDDITDNYVGHFIYMSDSYYEKVFEKDITFNSIITKKELDRNIDLNKEGILVANYTEDIAKTFDSFVKGLNKIIIMIVVLAAFLGFLVLYNLTTINLSERKREVATFKVLGFTLKEISTFVFRESLILSIVGIIFGLFLGNLLHKYIIFTAETDNIVFLKEITFFSYSISIVITLVFTFVIGLIMRKFLRKIDMIESLKITE